MKNVVSISLGSSSQDFEFSTRFLGKQLSVKRFGTDGNKAMAERLLKQWEKQADVIGIGLARDSYSVGPRRFVDKEAEDGRRSDTPARGQYPAPPAFMWRSVWRLHASEDGAFRGTCAHLVLRRYSGTCNPCVRKVEHNWEIHVAITERIVLGLLAVASASCTTGSGGVNMSQDNTAPYGAPAGIAAGLRST